MAKWIKLKSNADTNTVLLDVEAFKIVTYPSKVDPTNLDNTIDRFFELRTSLSDGDVFRVTGKNDFVSQEHKKVCRVLGVEHLPD